MLWGQQKNDGFWLIEWRGEKRVEHEPIIPSISHTKRIIGPHNIDGPHKEESCVQKQQLVKKPSTLADQIWQTTSWFVRSCRKSWCVNSSWSSKTRRFVNQFDLNKLDKLRTDSQKRKEVLWVKKRINKDRLTIFWWKFYTVQCGQYICSHWWWKNKCTDIGYDVRTWYYTSLMIL